MASRSTKGRDIRRGASRTAALPSSRPSQLTTFAASVSSSASASSRPKKRWVNPGPPPKLADMSDEDIRKCSIAYGIKERDFPAWKIGFKAGLAEQDAAMPPPIGMKPLDNGPGVLKIEIPGTSFIIRLWRGGVERFGQYCLDFFDLETDEPINSYEAGISVYPVHQNCTLPYGGIDGKLTSVEQACGSKPEEISHGNEKFIVNEGSRWLLRRNGAKEDFLFVVPSPPTPSEFHTFKPFEEVDAVQTTEV